MRLRRQRIAQENQQIDLIVFDLCAELLGTSQMTRQIFMEGQIRNLLNQAACRSCRIEFMLAQDAAICDTEVLHQFFFASCAINPIYIYTCLLNDSYFHNHKIQFPCSFTVHACTY